MRELQVLLEQHDKTIKFDHRNNRIRCYPHVINICSSHVIASSTRISKKFVETLKSACDGDLGYSNIEDDDDEDDDEDDDGDNDNYGTHSFARDIPELTLDDEQLDKLDDKTWDFYRHLKSDPIKRARRIVRILRSSDERRQAFKKVIENGNRSGWFVSQNKVIQIRDLELLRDVKTRWDSVYRMIERLLQLRLVSVHMYGRSYC
jgi:hypothetical protein